VFTFNYCHWTVLPLLLEKNIIRIANYSTMLRIGRYQKLIKGNIYIPLIGLFLLFSCDPARVLVVKVADKENYSVTIYSNENILPDSYSYQDDSVAKKIIIQVPTADTIPEYTKMFFYGFGGWSDSSLMPDFTKNIDSIIIVNGKGIVTLNTQYSINEYLIKNRSGFAKRRITIEAK